MEKDNANPTILNTSQLPTRQRKGGSAFSRSRDALLAATPLAPPSYLDSPIYKLEYGSSIGVESDSDSDFGPEPIDEQEIFDLISTISDPEHPLTLGQLAVVNLPDIDITPAPAPARPSDASRLTRVLVKITPTITHCSLATVIGLGVRVRLEQALPPNYRVDVMIKEGTHSQDDQVNKQLADKERVAAALENDTLKGVLDKMLETCV
ncbi:FAM96B-like protein [Microdochium trichocladiopsis]|uniref:FAM96B-like protein n=1 Tax=Microdochium trichocladiopsis TaxID=1682393 RepID=A0A9P8Y1N3_9PEZI|nr:FAM96B-like protein [Microdochium trichocladiopsis]KAH7027466.1 FAM96B-like protein [Microdochium trichocladiopsis]